MKNETIALIEIGGSHDECLLTQLHALHSAKKRIVFISTQEILDRNPWFENYIDTTYVFGQEEISQRFSAAKKIKKILKKENASKAILNTSHGNIMRNLCVLSLFSKVEFVGIIHSVAKLKGSLTQNLITLKIKKYFLLSEFLAYKAKKISKLNTDFFYPVRFQLMEKSRVEKEKKRIVVIGGVENRRKDLHGFVEMIASISISAEFIFLGKSDPENEEVIAFKSKIQSKGLTDKVQLFDHFVSNKTFTETVMSCDAILPLVHPNTPSAKEYFKHQISGAMTVAFGFKKPLLIHEAFSHIEEMKVGSVYYSQESFVSILEEGDKFKEREKAMQESQELKVETQEKRYLDFLES